MSNNAELLPQFNMIQSRSLIVAGGESLLIIIGAFFSTKQFLQSYLYGYIFWMGLTLGCLGILLLHHLVSGGWGHLIQRIVESGARTLPFMALLFIPIPIGMKSLYPWSNHDVLEANPVVYKKIGYLNIP